MYYVTSYTEKTVEAIAAHFETISKQAISFQVRKYHERGDMEMVERLKKASVLMVANRREAELAEQLGDNLVHGVGKYEKGRHRAYDRSTGKISYGYVAWEGMLKKAASDGSTVIRDFHKFQNFMTWAEDQRGFGETDFELNRDLMCTEWDIYDQGTCLFLHKDIIKAISAKATPHRDLPQGVYAHKPTGRYITHFQGKHVGYFATVEETLLAYKAAKKACIVSLAEQYKDKIKHRAYLALIEFEV